MRLLTIVLALAPTLGFAEISAELSQARERYLSGDFRGIWAVVQQEAEAGEPIAQNMLGAALTTQDGTKGLDYDPAAGLDWYERAAAQNLDKAVYNLALFWQEEHDGFEPDYDLSQVLAEKAAALGYVHAPVLIGDMYAAGKGFEQDDLKALIHYRRAADMGSYSGLRAVGYAYFHGQGIERDITQTRLYLDRAVAAGDTRSIPDLAYLYEGDEGIAADPLRAYTLYLYGVNRGNAKAAMWLAKFSTDTRFDGVWRDPVKGYAYCLKALSLGFDDDDSRAQCDGMASNLSVKQRATAQALAEDL